jgi:exopolysaccharide biosynthesis polyprenyl glycosylphosphotransferase
MFAHQRKRVRLFFAIADAVLTLAAFESAYVTRAHLTLDRVFFLPPHVHVLLAAVAAFLWVALGSRNHLYEQLGSARIQQVLVQTIRQCAFGAGGLILYEYLLRLDLSRGFLLVFLPYELLLLCLFRWQAPNLIGVFQRGFGSAYHVVLVGNEDRLSRLREQLADSPFRIHVTAELTANQCHERVPQLLAAHIVDEVIFNVPSETLSSLEPVFLQCDEEGVRTRIAIDFFPHINSEISLDRVGEASLLTFSAAPSDQLSLVAKRAFDVLVSAAALLILSPFMGLVAILIKLTSPGPVIYRQARCGLNGRRFTLLKFRSMVSNAEALRAELEHLNERQIAFKVARDPRVTPLGRFLRKYSIDELPQFWNVLQGDMSLVGPRPPVPEEVEKYERWQKRRLRMRPGLTCLWVLMGRDRLDFNSWMRTDISYIDNWSLTLDWSILLKSIPHVIAGKGAH